MPVEWKLPDLGACDWRDVSEPLRPEVSVWPGDVPFSAEAEGRISGGGASNVSTLTLSTHMGTHCDAPWHFEEAGKRTHELDTGLFFGWAWVLDCTGLEHIRAEDLGEGRLPERVLLKTDNSEIPLTAPFREDFAALLPCAARRLAEEGVRLVGIDYFSVGPFAAPAPVHHVLLGRDILIIENLRLSGVSGGRYPFVVLPMPLHGLDGAPCRAFLGLPRGNELSGV